MNGRSRFSPLALMGTEGTVAYRDSPPESGRRNSVSRKQPFPTGSNVPEPAIRQNAFVMTGFRPWIQPVDATH